MFRHLGRRVGGVALVRVGVTPRPTAVRWPCRYWATAGTGSNHDNANGGYGEHADTSTEDKDYLKGELPQPNETGVPSEMNFSQEMGESVMSFIETAVQQTKAHSSMSDTWSDQEWDDLRSARDMITHVLRQRQRYSDIDIVAPAVTKELRRWYSGLEWEEKIRFFRLLGLEFRCDLEVVEDLTNELVGMNKVPVRTMDEWSALIHTEKKLRQATVPIYLSLFKQISHEKKGLLFLVGLRADLLRATKDPRVRELAKGMSSSLKGLFRSYFSIGQLQVHQATFKSSAEVLDKIAEHEKVHQITNTQDIKRRVASDRRCFYFTHVAIPDEPLAIVHCALTTAICDNVQGIINQPHPPSGPLKIPIKSIVFYSISSPHRGLQGIDLGHLLIKEAVEKVTDEFPQCQAFSTLSPIPEFRRWFDRVVENANGEQRKLHLRPNERDMLLNMQGNKHTDLDCEDKHASEARALTILGGLAEKLGTDDISASELGIVKNILPRMCARYLTESKRNSSLYASDPVANFHVRNGAEVWRINWMGDDSPKGLQTSFGMMVNYRYFLEDLETNGQRYIRDGVMKHSVSVTELLAQNARTEFLRNF